MKSCVKWGGLLVLLLISVSALGAGYTYKVVPFSATHSVVRIHNDTGGFITSVLLVFEDSVVVDKALAYGKVAPAATIAGAGRVWQVTLAGNGLGAGARLAIAFTAGSVPVKFVGPGDLTVRTVTNKGDAAVPVIVFFFEGGVSVVEVLVFGAGAPSVLGVEGRKGGWRVTLDGDGLAAKAILALVVEGTAGVRRIIPAGIVAVAL